jgi:DNA-binding transcriptional LysR family regulator
MDLRRYQHLVALADARNFRRAATSVHLSQPAFSRSIQAAEAELGLTLFERGGAEIRCTPAGAFVVERARRLLRESGRLERDVALYRDKQLGELVFGIGPFAGPALLPALLQELRESYPLVRIRAEVANTGLLAAQLKREEIDFFVGDTRVARGDPALRIKQIGRLDGDFYVRRGHPLAGRKPVRLAELAPFGLACGRLPAEIQVLLAQAMGLPEGEPLPIALECDDAQALKSIILSTDTVMIGSPVLLRTELGAGQVVALDPVDMPPAYSELGVVSLLGRSFSPIAAASVECFERVSAQLTPQR